MSKFIRRPQTIEKYYIVFYYDIVYAMLIRYYNENRTIIIIYSKYYTELSGACTVCLYVRAGTAATAGAARSGRLACRGPVAKGLVYAAIASGHAYPVQSRRYGRHHTRSVDRSVGWTTSGVHATGKVTAQPLRPPPPLRLYSV